MRSSPSPWFVVGSPRPDPVARLFCFPYAGGSAQIFQDWHHYLPYEVEVVGVQYPGRGARVAERAITSCDQMIETLLVEFEPWLDVPYMFFGHSNGALVSFELARALQDSGSYLHIHQFISAKRAIHLDPRRKQLHDLPRDAFLREVERLGGTPAELLADPEFMEILLPILRADFSLSETYVRRDASPLKVDATILYGSRDVDIPEYDALRWAELVRGNIDHRSFDGGHFFINTHKRQVLEFMRAKMKAIMRQRVARPLALHG
jgi:medium-chain acyl-[acyl-carrier-protein] hydrolase